MATGKINNFFKDAARMFYLAEGKPGEKIKVSDVDYSQKDISVFERTISEMHKQRSAPSSDTPPLNELPGQGRCVGYLVGQRTWYLEFERGRVSSMRTEWVPFQPVKARVTSDLTVGAGAGLYAMKMDQEMNLSYSYDLRNLSVTGLVALWGQIKEHKLGYRAEWAYPLEFQELNMVSVFKEQILSFLNECYGCRPQKERVNCVYQPTLSGMVVGSGLGGLSGLNPLQQLANQSISAQLQSQQLTTAGLLNNLRGR